MDKYIERKVAINRIRKVANMMGFENPAVAIDCTISVLENTPAADVVPVRHGRWINWGDGVCCSVCGSEKPTKANDHKLSVKELNFCYYCGAKMDLED